VLPITRPTHRPHAQSSECRLQGVGEARRRLGAWAPLLAILVLAATLRLWALGGGPDPFDVDEGYAGVDALRVLAGHPTLYFAANNGAEPLYVYLAALSTALLGPSAFALRLPAALAGVACVLATFLLVRAVFRAEAASAPARTADGLALLAALLQAVSLWHLHLSRDASRVGLLPLLGTAAFYCLWRGIHDATGPPPPLCHPRLPARYWAWLAAAGACFGLALYTYLPARLLPLVAVILIAHVAVARRGWLRARWPGLLGLVAAGALTAAPLAAYYASHWSAFVFRVDMVSLANPWVNEGDPWGLLGRNLLGTVWMFTGRGDPDPQYNVAAQPVFPPALAGLFAIGLALAVARARRPAYGLWLTWLVVMLLPGVLSASSPHFARQAGIMPAVYVFPALALWAAWRWARGRGATVGLIAAGIGALVVGSAAFGTLLEYFGRPDVPGPTLLQRIEAAAPTDEVYVAGSEETAEIGSYLSGLNPQPRFTQGFHSLLLPRDATRTTYLVEREWWWETAEQLLWTRYDLEPQPTPPGLERFRVLRLRERPSPPDAPPSAPWLPLPAVRWAVGVRLVGYGLPPTARPGELVGVTLRWRVAAPAPDDPGQDYTFAVGLENEAGQEVAARDWLGHPTAAWREGDEVVSWFDLCLPPTLAPGELHATVALYSRADFVRRPLLDAAGAPLGDKLTFGRLPVDGPPQDPPCGARVHPALPP